MIVVHASVPIEPDHREEALRMIEDLVERSQDEDGTIDYRAATDVEEPNVVRFFEQYEDEAAFEAHSQTDHYREFAEELPDLLAGHPETVRFDVEEATQLEP